MSAAATAIASAICSAVNASGTTSFVRKHINGVMRTVRAPVVVDGVTPVGSV
jgi:hypothetical protein